MKKRSTTMLALLLLTFAPAFAQQFPVSSHYLVNPAALNPAFAGTFNRSELFMNFRRDWSAIEGSPRTVRINGDFPVYRNMFVGADVYADFADIFYRLKAGLNYTLKLEVGIDQTLSFGISGNYFQSVIRLDQANVDLDDPILKDLDRLFNANFNAAFGLVYSNRDFHAAFGMPVMFRTKDAYNNSGSGNFAFERAYDLYLTNSFAIQPNWQLKPGILVRKTINQPLILDLSALMVYNRQLWLGVLYRNTSLFGFTAGGRIIDGLVLNYTYEVGFGGINSYAGSTHEFTLGFTKPLDDTRIYRGNKKGKNRVDIREKPKEERQKKQKRNKQKTLKSKPVKRTQPLQPLKYAPYEKF